MKFKQKLPLSLAAIALTASNLVAAQTTLLNASYDVSREFYKDYNAAFVANHKKTTGKDVRSTSPMAAQVPRRAQSTTGLMRMW